MLDILRPKQHLVLTINRLRLITALSPRQVRKVRQKLVDIVHWLSFLVEEVHWSSFKVKHFFDLECDLAQDILSCLKSVRQMDVRLELAEIFLDH